MIDPKTNKLIAEKLINSQVLLEALATNDYDKMTKHAEQLIEISRAAEMDRVQDAPT